MAHSSGNHLRARHETGELRRREQCSRRRLPLVCSLKYCHTLGPSYCCCYYYYYYLILALPVLLLLTLLALLALVLLAVGACEKRWAGGGGRASFSN